MVPLCQECATDSLSNDSSKLPLGMAMQAYSPLGTPDSAGKDN